MQQNLRLPAFLKPTPSEFVSSRFDRAQNGGNSMTVNDKRMHFRKSLHAEASIADVLGNTWSQINFLDISRNGAAFISPDELATGSSRMVRFHLPNNPTRISAICKIIHCAAHTYLPGYRVGAEFVRIDSEDVKLIDDFIAKANDVVT